MTQKENRRFYIDQEIVIKGRPLQQFSSISAAKEPKSEDVIHIKKKNKDGTKKMVTLVVKKIDNQAQRRELEKTAKKVLEIFAEESVSEEENDGDYGGGLLY